MSDIAPPVAALIEEFSKLPGVGVKTAQRLTFFILRSPTDQARRLAEAIMRVKESIIYCSRCFNITETDHLMAANRHVLKVAQEAGFSNLRRAAQTPVNLILELTP